MPIRTPDDTHEMKQAVNAYISVLLDYTYGKPSMDDVFGAEQALTSALLEQGVIHPSEDVADTFPADTGVGVCVVLKSGETFIAWHTGEVS